MRAFRVRFRRPAVIGAVIVAAMVIASCRGYTTAATSIVEQPNRAYSAKLNAVGSCGAGEHCSFYMRYRRVGTSAWSHAAGALRGPFAGPVPKVLLIVKVTGLASTARYEYQVCGNAQPGQQFSCVGPDGTSKTTTKFATPSPRPTVTAVDDGVGDGNLLFDDGSTVTVSGTGFSTAPGATTFDFEGATPTDIVCQSTTKCTMITPNPGSPSTDPFDVIATVYGLASLPNPPYDQAEYFGFSCGCDGGAG